MARQVLPIVGQAIGSIWGPWSAAIGGMIGSAAGSAVDPNAGHEEERDDESAECMGKP